MVRLENLSKTFHPGEVNEVTAVKDASLHVPEGQFVVVIGGNGSGKSTLLNLVAGTVLSDTGKVFVAGNDLTRVPEHARASLIGRVFQDPMKGTASGLTIEENFALAASRGEFRGLNPALSKGLRNAIRERLAVLGLGLEKRMKAKVGLLSGGQRQAISILMAVFKRPRVLLLDEHTAALDPRASGKIMNLTRDIVADQHLTTVMITHNLAHCLEIGDRTIVMSLGRIVLDLGRDRLDGMNVQDLLNLFWETQIREEQGYQDQTARSLR